MKRPNPRDDRTVERRSPAALNHAAMTSQFRILSVTASQPALP